MDIGDKIRVLRKQQGLTLEDVGNVVGVGKSTVRKWESGIIANMRRDKIALLAKALHVTPAFLMGWTEDPEDSLSQPLPSTLIPINQLHRQRVPVIGHVAAGVPIMAEQEYETFVESPVRCDAALIVDGDSMAPTYLPHDLVYIRHQPDVLDGQVGIVLIDDSATMKHVYHKPYGLLLVSDNPAYPPMDIRGDEHDYLSIFGLVVGYTRMYE